MAYYNGRYYVYFGVVPCLLFQLPFETLTGIRDLPPALPMILLAWLYILAVFGFVKQAAPLVPAGKRRSLPAHRRGRGLGHTDLLSAPPPVGV